MDKRIKIIYEDRDILVCRKAAGIAVQSARMKEADMVSELKNELFRRDVQKGEPYLGVIHRLDQPVQGVLVFAKNRKAAASLSSQASDGRMKKIYHAVVRIDTGSEKTHSGMLTDHLLKDGKTNTSRVVSPQTAGAKKAVLEYAFLKDNRQIPDAALVRICLYTGRHHQIRVQMAHAGMPLLGDRKYGAGSDAGNSNRFLDGDNEDLRTGGYGNRTGEELALCAVSLEFVHPGTGKAVTFSCEPEGVYFELFGEAAAGETVTRH